MAPTDFLENHELEPFIDWLKGCGWDAGQKLTGQPEGVGDLAWQATKKDEAVNVFGSGKVTASPGVIGGAPRLISDFRASRK